MENDEISYASVSKWLKIKHLLLIDTLARTRNMHTTAELMNLTQPAISKMLRDIERLLGFALFERQPRGMVLTAAGEILAVHARRSRMDAEHALEGIQALQGLRSGLVRVAATEGFSGDFLPRLMQQFRLLHPQIQF